MQHTSKTPAILFTTTNLEFAGASISTCMLAEGFKKKRYHVTVLSPVDGPLRERCVNKNIDTVIDESYFDESADTDDFIKEFDLICINSIAFSSGLVRRTQNVDVPVVWIVRESDREYQEKIGGDLSLLAHVDRVIFVSDSTRRIYEDLNTRNNFLTIPNGIDIKRIDLFKESNSKEDMCKKYGFDYKKNIVTIIGNICERKGQLHFVNAAINLLKSNSNLLFLVVGKFSHNEPDYVNCIENRIRASGSTLDIRIMPNTPDVWDYYVMSDVLVCASNNESFPRVVLEGMAFGLPIVATDVFGIPEQISNKTEGLLIKPNDPSQIEKGISHMLENPDDAARMAKNADEKVTTNFTMDRIIQRHMELYNNLIVV